MNKFKNEFNNLFKRKSLASKIFTIFIYGLVNFILVLLLVSVTKFNNHAPYQSQLLQICLIIFITGLVDYIGINRKF